MEAARVQGELRLLVDESGLEAQLEFTPDPAGAAWSASKVDKLLADRRIDSIDHAKVDQALVAFSRATGRTRLVVAYGIPPTGPLPETAEWEELAIPDEFKHLADEAMLAAPPPAAYKTVVETVRVERTVQKPGFLPFMQKEEKVVTSERREVKKRVSIDSTVRRIGYANKGDKLATIYAPKAGKAGKSVLGKALPAPSGTDTSFYLGEGVRREKTELFAATSGFVRIGDRWADIVPASGHRWELERSADKATFLFSFEPGHEKIEPPRAEEVLAEALAQGAKAADLIPVSELARAIAEAQAQKKALARFSLSVDRDAHMEVSVSEDRMHANLYLRKGSGRGKALELPAIARAIAGYKFVPLDTERLKKALVDFYRSEETELKALEFATGQSPTRGKDRGIAYELAFLPEDKAAALVKGILADPKASRLSPSLAEHPIPPDAKVSMVRKGQRIAELSPPTFGESGRDVFGATARALPGNEAPVRALENVRFGGASYEAAESGIFVLSREKDLSYMRVFPRQDAMIDVSVSQDGMKARISLQAEIGLGAPLTIERALAAVEAKGVKAGFDRAALEAALAEAMAGKPVATREIARGVEPVPASGAVVRYLVPLEPKGERKVAEVAAGACLAEVRGSGSEGTPGTDVYGNELAPGVGAAVAPSVDGSIRVETGPDGVTRYYAVSGGELAVSGSAMAIGKSREHSGNVDASTGHLKFGGAIHVRGGVASGLKVIGSGDVTVDGPVGASLVSSDGTILLSSGVKGSGKAVIRAKRHIMALHAEQASLMAVDDIKVKNGCISCVVKTNGRLLLMSDKGHLAGSKVRARKGVEAQILGSVDGQETLVSFGQDYLIQDLIESEEREIEAIRARIQATDRKMAELERLGGALEAIRAEKLALMKLLEKHNLKVFNLRERFEEHFPAEIRARAAVHPGVVLECHNRFFEVDARRGATVFTFDMESGRIVASDPRSP